MDNNTKDPVTDVTDNLPITMNHFNVSFSKLSPFAGFEYISVMINNTLVQTIVAEDTYSIPLTNFANANQINVDIIRSCSYLGSLIPNPPDPDPSLLETHWVLDYAHATLIKDWSELDPDWLEMIGLDDPENQVDTYEYAWNEENEEWEEIRGGGEWPYDIALSHTFNESTGDVSILATANINNQNVQVSASGNGFGTASQNFYIPCYQDDGSPEEGIPPSDPVGSIKITISVDISASEEPLEVQ